MLHGHQHSNGRGQYSNGVDWVKMGSPQAWNSDLPTNVIVHITQDRLTSAHYLTKEGSEGWLTNLIVDKTIN